MSLYVVARNKSSSNSFIELFKITTANQVTSQGVVASGASNPTMTNRYPEIYDSRLFIAWENNNSIYYRTFSTSGGSFGTTETVVSPGSGIYFHDSPNITYSLDNRINIVWAGSSGSVKYLLRRSKSVSSSSWGALDYIYSSYSDLTQPSVGSFYDPTHSGWLNVAVKLGSNNVRTLQWNNRNWQFHSTWLNGQHPSMTDKADGDLMLAGTDHTGSLPYDIFSKAYTAGQLSKVMATGGGEIARHTRREELNLAAFPGNLRGTVGVEIGESGRFHPNPQDDVDAMKECKNDK